MTLLAAGTDVAECWSRMVRLEQQWTTSAGYRRRLIDHNRALKNQLVGDQGTRMFLTYEYFLFAIPGMALSMWAQARISTAYAEASRILARAGVTGAEAAST